jgi:hypothetical protein
MGWEEELFALFDDLEGQAEALYDAERGPDLADRSRAEYRQVTLASRLMASLDRPLVLTVRGVGSVAGTLERVAAGWCLLRGAGQDWLLPLAAVESVTGASERAVPEVAWSQVTKLGIGSALRGLADTGSPCVLHLVDGSRLDAVLRRVGDDFVEALVGEADGGRLVLVAFSGLAAVSSRP